ncbi:hypothetical protein [Clostridium sp. AM58-1XD]|uniref:hypothetical protein n=1 Tax=Clostridium sp. AM58-1XD TaxID=2292307 RepID=UPI000E4F8F51|nr:hypothetical protein [Clostridium sp. AM58-1XD]RGY97276.1 hypothetical protein DXA13_15155 [Clostridium sp. AM58-1XD]
MIQAEKFTGKLNKLDGNIYTVEEPVNLVNGSYEGELLHDNINEATIAVFTGPKLTGERLQTYSISTPSLTPWKRNIRVFADVDIVYISYETDGDTVEAEDINRVQEAVVKTQEALNAEETRAGQAEQANADKIADEITRQKPQRMISGTRFIPISRIGMINIHEMKLITNFLPWRRLSTGKKRSIRMQILPPHIRSRKMAGR